MRKEAVVEPIGEVIAAGTAQFTAQCPRSLLHQPPVFGAFVKIAPEAARFEAFTDPFARNNADTAAGPVAERVAGSSTETRSDTRIGPFAKTTAAAVDGASAEPIDDPFAEPSVPNFGLSADTPEETLYAVVYSAGTGSAEPGRRPTAYGLEEDRLRHEQPQIFDLLATEFSALHVGSVRSGRFRAGIPPRPPRLHAPVSECSPEEVCAVTETPEFLRALVKSSQDIPVDELIVACVRHAYNCRGDNYPYLVRAGKQLAALLRDDPDRLTALLDRLDPL